MKQAAVAVMVAAACGGPAPPAPTPPSRWQPPPEWQGWRHEPIPFPLDFAPSLAHRGVEELWFAPGFFEPDAPGYWSYTFVWRLEDAADLDATQLGDELTAYFRGLIDAVDQDHKITARDEIRATATRKGERFVLAARVFDAFKTMAPVELSGWAKRLQCDGGSLWTFVLAPGTSGVRPRLDQLANTAACGQPVPPPKPKSAP